ncbi:MAG: penicillin-binding protein 2, partial [Gammaproteobacteria bacterium]|nr:penicillin-binding protein 2 [Gammaproteobacteria bacterium]
MHDFMSAFGFGRLTGIDISGEKSGLMPSPAWKRHAYKDAANQVWFPGETLIVGIGQGYMLATPLQLAHAVATLSERGIAFKPRLVIGIRPPGSTRLVRLPVDKEPGIAGITPDQWEVVDEGMEAAAQPGGTVANISVGAPYRIAAKTGTAQVFSLHQNQKYNASQIAERMRDHGLLIAFAPVDHPKLAVAVFVENGEHGGTIGGPIARKVLDAYLLPDKAAPPRTKPMTGPAP